MGRLAAEGVGTALLVLFGAGMAMAALNVGKGTLDYAGPGFRGLLLRRRRGLGHLRLRTGVRRPHQPGLHKQAGRDRSFPVAGGTYLRRRPARRCCCRWVAHRGARDLLVEVHDHGGRADSRAPLGWPGFPIGLTVVCEILLIGPLTGGTVNPARTFGSDVVTALFGGAAAWSQLVVYWVGPLGGAGVAALVYDFEAQSWAAETADKDAFTPTGDAGALTYS